jgi:hypothetical protein
MPFATALPPQAVAAPPVADAPAGIPGNRMLSQTMFCAEAGGAPSMNPVAMTMPTAMPVKMSDRPLGRRSRRDFFASVCICSLPFVTHYALYVFVSPDVSRDMRERVFAEPDRLRLRHADGSR